MTSLLSSAYVIPSVILINMISLLISASFSRINNKNEFEFIKWNVSLLTGVSTGGPGRNGEEESSLPLCSPPPHSFSAPK